MSPKLPWTSFDPEAGASDGSLSLPVEEGSIPVVALLAGEQEEAGGWSPRAALALVRGWARDGGRIVLADLGLDAPALHALLGEDNGEGITDAVLYGASVQRVAGRPSGERFILIPSGTPVVDPEPVLTHPRWKTLIAGFQEAGAILVLYLPVSLPGARVLAERCTFRVQLGGGEEDLWGWAAELRLRPDSPLPRETDEVEAEPEPPLESGVQAQEDTLAVEPGEEVLPLPPRPSIDRLSPAPVPREIPRPRMIPLVAGLQEPMTLPPAGDEEAGLPPGEVELPSGGESAFLDEAPSTGESSSAEESPVHEPVTWEEADPWDLPELQPLHGEVGGEEGLQDLTEASGESMDQGGGGAGEPLLDDGPTAESPAAAELEPHGIPQEELDQSLEGESDPLSGEFEPHGVPEDELGIPVTGDADPDALEYEPHGIHGDDLPVLPHSEPGEIELEPHGVLQDEPEVESRDGEEEGSDPFGFLGEWGGDREDEGEADAGSQTVEGESSGSGPGWGEPLESWEGANRSWDEAYASATESEAGSPAPEPPHAGDPDPEPLPVDMAAPLPPEAPAAWSAPSGEEAQETVPRVVSPGPARKPLAPPRPERATGAWVLFLLLLAVAVLLGAARLGFIQIPGVTPQQGDSPLQPGLGATSTAEAASVEEPAPPVDDLLLVVEPTSPVHALALALTAFGSAAGARAAAERLRPSLPQHPVMVAPVQSGGQLYHRLMVGGAVNYEEVEELREVLAPLYPGSPPSEWIVREADRAFLLAETASQGEAESQLAPLLERGIPAYVLEVPLTDGARLWRVYAGAYGSDGEASALAAILQEAGEGAPPLVPLTGRPPG